MRIINGLIECVWAPTGIKLRKVLLQNSVSAEQMQNNRVLSRADGNSGGLTFSVLGVDDDELKN